MNVVSAASVLKLKFSMSEIKINIVPILINKQDVH